jgi:hypothetical protein
MRAATEMKFVATTTLGIEQRLALLAEQHLLDLAEEHGMRAVRDLLHQPAVEGHERVDEHG